MTLQTSDEFASAYWIPFVHMSHHLESRDQAVVRRDQQFRLFFYSMYPRSTYSA